MPSGEWKWVNRNVGSSVAKRVVSPRRLVIIIIIVIILNPQY